MSTLTRWIRSWSLRAKLAAVALLPAMLGFVFRDSYRWLAAALFLLAGAFLVAAAAGPLLSVRSWLPRANE